MRYEVNVTTGEIIQREATAEELAQEAADHAAAANVSFPVTIASCYAEEWFFRQRHNKSPKLRIRTPHRDRRFQ